MTAADRHIDFIGIGAPRCGTTWLSECLREHPDIAFPIHGWSDGIAPEGLRNTGTKELDFFISGRRMPSNYARGLEWYLSRFPASRPGTIRGEFSPSYLDDPAAPALIHRAFPQVKLVALLRDPTDMIGSLHSFNSNFPSHGRLSLEQEIDQGGYLEVGMYCRNLGRFVALFPRNRMHVVIYDDILRDPGRVVRDAYSFLGVRADFVPQALTKRINATRHTRSTLLKNTVSRLMCTLDAVGLGAMVRRAASRNVLARLYYEANTVPGKHGEISDETRRRLKAYFRDDILALELLLGRSLQGWL